MIHIIYMAAGNSRRFGSNKLFYELEGKPMYRHLLERLVEIKDRYNNSRGIGLSKKIGKKTKNTESSSQLIDITVVTRYREILDYCSSIPDCRAVLSPDSEKGISYTIKAGIMAVQEQKKTGMQIGQNGVRQKKQEKSSGVLQNSAETEEYYMFAVADQPYLKSQSVIKLIDKVLENTEDERLAFSLRCKDAVGNPCVFNSSLVPQLLSLEGDKGGRSVAKKHDCVYVDIADASELMDIDTLSNSKQTGTL
ncbi:nucleotidyltransferase family protein [Agathobacter sp.]|uniref:nucleotidyltransferase family protein n=1 Tax=Agathobacter sp. TaxID=2021311 RepID=UPI003FD82B18